MWIAERVLFHYGNHPVKWVRVTGVIVAVDEYAGRNVYTVDDSSGMCIECVCVTPTPPPKTETTVPAHLNQIALLNQAIREGHVRKVGGNPVDQPVDGALIRADRSIAYPIRDGIPVMLVAEGLSIPQVNLNGHARA